MARGYRTAKRHLSHSQEEEKDSFWVSYTDLMSGLLVIFALVLMIAMFNMQSTYEETQAVIAEKEEALEQQNEMIEELVGVKSDIVRELVKAFEESNLNLEIDKQTGAIRFSGGVFFETASSEISSSGQQYLEQFIPEYIGILLSDQFRDEISQIVVEGHTDTEGGYLYNLKLSQDRALSVVQKISAPEFPDFPHREVVTNVITANGRAFSVPIYNNDGQIDFEKSRRVEFKFRLKDDEVLDKIQDMVAEHEKQ
jgi:outer membrane protein OmpA-like peptidoglycan-associated protein